jgi:hypothetical protein
MGLTLGQQVAEIGRQKNLRQTGLLLLARKPRRFESLNPSRLRQSARRRAAIAGDVSGGRESGDCGAKEGEGVRRRKCISVLIVQEADAPT